MGNINIAVDWAIKIANDESHGYDQINRNGPDYDCSSFVSTALNKAGFPISIYSWTGNMKKQLLDAGFKVCSSPWKKGDIHLNELNHVCMSVDSNNIVEASINEFGGIKGGEPGDQTGTEIRIKPYYEYRKGWDIHLRYERKELKPRKQNFSEVKYNA